MSADWGLVKFKKTGNIYMCCYEGTSDILNPYICTPEECYDEQRDCYCAITHCRMIGASHDDWAFPDYVQDLDEVEIYTDYGGGFYWYGTGSESIMMIKGPLDTWAFDEDASVIDGRPKWVDEFWSQLLNAKKED